MPAAAHTGLPALLAMQAYRVTYTDVARRALTQPWVVRQVLSPYKCHQFTPDTVDRIRESIADMLLERGWRGNTELLWQGYDMPPMEQAA